MNTAHSCTGTSVAFTGNTPQQIDSQWVMVSIDGGTPYKSSYMDPSPPSVRQWYQSPTLSDGKHSIAITHIASTSVDYAVVTAGPNTHVGGATLIADDGDPAITYKGSWSQSNSFTSTDSPYIGLPYGNGTHRTTSAGDSATFTFSGRSTTSWDILIVSLRQNRYRCHHLWPVYLERPWYNFRPIHAGWRLFHPRLHRHPFYAAVFKWCKATEQL
jgi:hypothetical protein